MAAPNLDEINTLTTKKIMPGLVDNLVGARYSEASQRMIDR